MKLGRLFLAALSGAMGGVANARISVSATNGGTYDLVSFGNNEYGLTLTATAEDLVTAFTITRTTGADSLRFLDIESSNPGGVTVLAIASTNLEINHIEAIKVIDDQGYTYIAQMDIAGHLGPTTINRINNSRVGGNVTGDIRLLFHPYTEIDSNFRTGLTLAVTGNVLGDITLEDNGEVLGVIGQLDVSGTIGAQGTPIDIRVGSSIVFLRAGEINASIRGTGASGESSFIGQVFQLEATDDFGGSGIFRGDLRCRFSDFPEIEIPRFIRATDDFEATVYIGGDYTEKIELIPVIESQKAAGLEGRVIVNALNESGVWAADVKIGSGGGVVTLDGNSYSEQAAYPNTSASLGGGAVGEVPFKLHRTDCTPIHATTADPASVGNEILMRHYGPVYWNSADGQPFLVERRKRGSSNSWQLQDCFTCTLDSNDTIVKVATSTVSSLQRGFEYRVVRRTRGDGSNVLRCKLPHLAASAYPEVFDYTPLTFSVCDTFPAHAPGDADDTGIVDDEDVDSVLANWGSTACMKFGDATRDGVVNSADLQEAELYYTWEYCYSEGMAVGDHGDGFTTLGLDEGAAAMNAPMTISEAVAAMGYDDIDDFGAAFDAMEPAARAAARGVLLALISGE